MSDKIGGVYLVVAGCGNFDLITLKGKNLLEKCDVVVYDSLIDEKLLDFVPEKAEKISVGKRAGKHSETQENINSILLHKAQEGKMVVRLKGGDPFVFGRGGEEIAWLKKYNVPYSVVPGISSSVACPELAGIPVTHRRVSRSFHVITGHTADDLLPENFKNYAHDNGTLVFLMGLKNISKITDGLLSNGKDPSTPCAVISNGGRKNQTVIRSSLDSIVSDVNENKIHSPAVIVVGETAGYDFSSTIKLPLENITVSITGTKRLTDKLMTELSELGATVKKVYSLKVKEFEDNFEFDNALKEINDYQVVVLTSMNGANIFLNRLKEDHIDIRKLSDIRFAVVGSGTAEVLENVGIFPDIVPEKYTVECLGNKLVESLRADDRLLILRASQASPLLTKILSDNHINYKEIKTYDVEGDHKSSCNVKTDFLTFASASGVEEFFASGCSISEKTKVICIGEITACVLRKHGVSEYSVCETQNVQGIIDSILMEAAK